MSETDLVSAPKTAIRGDWDDGVASATNGHGTHGQVLTRDRPVSPGRAGDGLAVENLAVRFGPVAALRGIDLTVETGEIVTIVGANGAGKSTLLNSIAGVVTPSAGSISWRGQTLGGLPARGVLAAGVGYVPEGRAVFGALSVLDNLLLGAYGRRSAGGDAWWRLIAPRASFARQATVAGGLERVFGLFPRLKERRTQLAGSLSGGEQQMLAIGRALMAEPRLLLLDEPSVGLAPLVVRELLGLLPRLRESGLTILLVEQDAIAALRVADRGYVLEHGTVAIAGASAVLLASDRVRRAYLGG